LVRKSLRKLRDRAVQINNLQYVYPEISDYKLVPAIELSPHLVFFRLRGFRFFKLPIAGFGSRIVKSVLGCDSAILCLFVLKVFD